MVLIFSSPSWAEPSLTLKQLEFKLWLGHRRDTPQNAMYVLLGCCWMLNTPMTDDGPEFIARWIASHPDAIVTVVDQEQMFADEKRDGHATMVFAWVQDGDESLGLTLIREGIIPSGMMADGVAHLDTIPDLDRKSPTYPKRVISDAEYEAFMKRALAAEALAVKEGKGIWSDRYKEEREIWGLE